MVGLAIAGPFDSVPPGFVNIVLGEGSGLSGSSEFPLGALKYSGLETGSSVGFEALVVKWSFV